MVSDELTPEFMLRLFTQAKTDTEIRFATQILINAYKESSSQGKSLTNEDVLHKIVDNISASTPNKDNVFCAVDAVTMIAHYYPKVIDRYTRDVVKALKKSSISVTGIKNCLAIIKQNCPHLDAARSASQIKKPFRPSDLNERQPEKKIRRLAAG